MVFRRLRADAKIIGTVIGHFRTGAFLFLIGGAAAAQANVSFKNGFSFVDGDFKTELHQLSEKTTILCNPFCELSIDGKLVRMEFSGFGPLGDLMKLSLTLNQRSQILNWIQLQGNRNQKVAASPAMPSPTVSVSPSPNVPSPKPDGVAVKVPDRKAGANQIKAPYPAENTLFLVKHAGEVLLFPKSVCDVPCDFAVSLDAEHSSVHHFEAGQSPILSITLKPETSGTVTMTLTSGAKQTMSHFSWQKFETKNLGAAVRRNQNVEILP